MPTTITDLMTQSLLGVFGERDPGARTAVIERTYAPDVRFFDPEGVTTGTTALGHKVQALLDRTPIFAFAADGPVRESEGLGHLSWTFGPPGVEPVVRGFDIAIVDGDKITALHTFVTSA